MKPSENLKDLFVRVTLNEPDEGAIGYMRDALGISLEKNEIFLNIHFNFKYQDEIFLMGITVCKNKKTGKILPSFTKVGVYHASTKMVLNNVDRSEEFNKIYDGYSVPFPNIKQSLNVFIVNYIIEKINEQIPTTLNSVDEEKVKSILSKFVFNHKGYDYNPKTFWDFYRPIFDITQEKIELESTVVNSANKAPVFKA